MSRKIIIGNWKMNKTLEEGQVLASEITRMAAHEVHDDVTLVMCTPAIHLNSVSAITKGIVNLFVGAQNISEHASGAYTGDISADMVYSAGATFVLLGHSERRSHHFETNAQLSQRVKLALSKGITPVFCCGEPLETRESGQHIDFVNTQLTESLFDLSAEAIQKIVIAYEPIWAIGTGVTARSEQAQEMHHNIRAYIANRYTSEVAGEIPVLYGGSMKPANAGELLAQPDVDGGLIGGASLKAEDFISIAKAY